jgi:hypothetical protein
MSPSIAGAGIRPGGRDMLCILDAKSGFALDRVQTIFKGRKIAVSGSAGKIRAPLLVWLITLCSCPACECARNNQDRNRYQQYPPPGQSPGFLKCRVTFPI